jgi:hypothetical protein
VCDKDLKTPDNVFLTSAATVALSTATLPYITGYGTVLFPLVVLGASSLDAHFSSGLFAEHNHSVIDGVIETFAALRTSVIRAVYGAGKRRPAVERNRRTMFADKPSRVVFNRIIPAAASPQEPIFDVALKVRQARHTWLRF